jgi:hypothetical protein
MKRGVTGLCSDKAVTFRPSVRDMRCYDLDSPDGAKRWAINR